MRRYMKTAWVAALVIAAGCDETGTVEGLPESIDTQVRRSIGNWGVVPIGAMPRQQPALVALGQSLMFDKILSGNRDISCASCHEPALHATDGLPLAVGTGGTGQGAERTLGAGRQFVPRNAPSLLNTGIGLFYIFWDGRLARFEPGRPGAPLPPNLPNLLAAQALLPVLNRVEMRGNPGDVDVFGNPNELAAFGDSQSTQIWQAVMARLLAVPEYVSMFAAAFPATPRSQLGFQHAAAAMAAFQMEMLTKANTPFDRFLSRDNTALTTEQKRGALLFFGDAQCASCHNGPFLGGQSFANTGVPQIGPGVGNAAPLDFGRGEVLNVEFYRFAFRIPPLRNVELTAPYFHNGTFATLESAVAHYNDVTTSLRTYDPSQLPAAFQSSYHGDVSTNNAILATLDFRLRQPLNLTDTQLAEIVAFLRSLTDPAARDLSAIAPSSVPSGLPLR